jgi:hypothetical protein
VHGVVYVLPVAYLFEHKFRLRAEIGSLANGGTFQVSLRLLRDVPGVAAIGLASDRVPDVADQGERRRHSERIEKSCGRVCDDEHVAFLDFLEAPYRRAVETDALIESIGICQTPGKSVNRKSIM